MIGQVWAVVALVGTLVTESAETYPEAELTPAAHQARYQKEIATWKDAVARSGVSVGN